MEEKLREQYRIIRSEVESWMSSVRRLEQIAIVSTGAICAWALTADPEKVDRVFITMALLGPLLINSLVALRIFATAKHLENHEVFLRRIEKELKLGDLGWETYMKPKRDEGRRIMRYSVGLTVIILMAVSILVPLVYWLKPDHGAP